MTKSISWLRTGFALVVLFGLVAIPGPLRAAEVERITTPAGIEVWYVREPTIPIISVSFVFRGGGALAPAGQEGLAGFAMSLLDEGAGELDSLAFQQAVVDRAIKLSFQAGRDNLSGQLQTISQHRDEAFRLLGLALTKPRFEAQAVERIRSQILSGIANDERDPQSVAIRTWFRAMFADHPYGLPSDGTPESVAAITAEDLRVFVSGRIARDNLVVGAAGDVDAAEIAKLVDSAFADLPANAAPGVTPEAALPAKGRTIVERMPIPQSVISFGMPGLKRDDPDFYIAYVMNYALGGGGFTSRLYAEVREKRGLAYSVYSYLHPMDHAALYLGGAATRNDSVAESIEIIRAEIARFAEEGVSEEEITAAKRYLTGAFPLRFDSSSKIAGMLASMQLDDLGIGYIERRNDLINGVTTEDVRRVARRLLDLDRLTLVVVGDPEGVESTP